MARSTLTYPQLSALRSLDPEDRYAPSYDIPARTLTSLRRRGFVKKDALELTGFGERWIRSYVRQTGNGPEDLKGLFAGMFT